MADPAPPTDPEPDESLGQRIRRLRARRGLSSSALAMRAGLSKSYISTLESETDRSRRPSVLTLQRLAAGLDVGLAEVIGTSVPQPASTPPALATFAAESELPESDVEMLASIRFPGEQPRSIDRWRYIYQAIRTSETLDREPANAVSRQSDPHERLLGKSPAEPDGTAANAAEGPNVSAPTGEQTQVAAIRQAANFRRGDRGEHIIQGRNGQGRATDAIGPVPRASKEQR
jgi:transcriptional regulator with XRE-family HTH domain